MKVRALVENLPFTNEAWEYDGQLQHVYDMPPDVQWPYYYGCIPDIISGDGAPLDIFVISSDHYKRGEFVDANVFNVLNFVDRGMDDPKILAIPVGTETPVEKELETIYLAITSFIAAKKKHSGTEFEFRGLGGREQAESMLI